MIINTNSLQLLLPRAIRICICKAPLNFALRANCAAWDRVRYAAATTSKLTISPSLEHRPSTRRVSLRTTYCRAYERAKRPLLLRSLTEFPQKKSWLETRSKIIGLAWTLACTQSAPTAAAYKTCRGLIKSGILLNKGILTKTISQLGTIDCRILIGPMKKNSI